MPMSTQDRIELLKKAREAKKLKGDAKKQEKIDKKPKKVTPVTQEDDDADVEEQIIYEKIPKKKKKIVRKIIRQVESSSDDDVEEQIIYERPPKKTIQARPHQVERPRPQTPPRQVEVEPRNPFFNY
jgi:hypothetical protein